MALTHPGTRISGDDALNPRAGGGLVATADDGSNVGWRPPATPGADVYLVMPDGVGTGGQVLTSDGLGGVIWATPASGVTDHGALTGLTDDDHTQYALLAGRAGGQTIVGGTASGDDLTIKSNPTNDGTVTIDGVEIGLSGAATYLKATTDVAGSNDWMLVPVQPGYIGLRNSGGTIYRSFWAEGMIFGSTQKVGIRGGLNMIEVASDASIAFSSNGFYYGAKDVGFARDAAGVVRTTNGSTGNGDHKMAALRLVPYTTAGRPTAGVAGRQIYDSTLGKPIWDNGTQWTDATGAIV